MGASGPWSGLGPTVHVLLAYILYAGKRQHFSLRSGTKQGCQFSPLLLNIVLEALATAISQEK